MPPTGWRTTSNTRLRTRATPLLHGALLHTGVALVTRGPITRCHLDVSAGHTGYQGADTPLLHRVPRRRHAPITQGIKVLPRPYHTGHQDAATPLLHRASRCCHAPITQGIKALPRPYYTGHQGAARGLPGACTPPLLLQHSVRV